MDFYQIKWKTSAKKDLRKISADAIPKILKAIDSLSNNPYPQGCKKMADTNSNYRIRIGNYRVIYTIFDDVLVIEIIKVGHRQGVYDS
ncbi:MAG TPA: type II toxin-antitoxin system RelE/ParE family toxin [Allocoleopsis sp.]